MFQNKIPPISELEYYTAYLKSKKREKYFNCQSQIVCARTLIWKAPHTLAAPTVENPNGIHIIIPAAGHNFLPALLQEYSLRITGPHHLHRRIYELCISYTMNFKLAPCWNRLDDIFIQGLDFLLNGGVYNAVYFDSTVLENDSELKVTVKVQTIQYNPICFDTDIGISFDNLKAVGSAKLAGNLMFALPNMKSCFGVSITSSIPASCPYTDYKSIRSHWKNMYGIRLPHSEENVFYIQACYKYGGTLYTYPHFCLTATKPVIFPGNENPDYVTARFIQDLSQKVEDICGTPIDFKEVLFDNKFNIVKIDSNNFLNVNASAEIADENNVITAKIEVQDLKGSKLPPITPIFLPKKKPMALPQNKQATPVMLPKNENTSYQDYNSSAIMNQVISINSVPSVNSSFVYTPVFAKKQKISLKNTMTLPCKQDTKQDLTALKPAKRPVEMVKTPDIHLPAKFIKKIPAKEVQPMKIPMPGLAPTNEVAFIPTNPPPSTQTAVQPQFVQKPVAVVPPPKVSFAPARPTAPTQNQVQQLKISHVPMAGLNARPKESAFVPITMPPTPTHNPVNVVQQYGPVAGLASSGEVTFVPIAVAPPPTRPAPPPMQPLFVAAPPTPAINFDDLFAPQLLLPNPAQLNLTIVNQKPQPHLQNAGLPKVPKEKKFIDVQVVKEALLSKTLHKINLLSLYNFCKLNAIPVKSKWKKEAVVQMMYDFTQNQPCN